MDRLKNLRILNLASNPLGLELNQFSDYILSLDNLVFLEDLNLSNTSLPDFPLSLINGTKNIKRLTLSNNMITFLPEGILQELTSLEYLDLSGNYFETLAPFGFNGLSALKTLVVDRMPYLKKIEQHVLQKNTSSNAMHDVFIQFVLTVHLGICWVVLIKRVILPEKSHVMAYRCYGISGMLHSITVLSAHDFIVFMILYEIRWLKN